MFLSASPRSLSHLARKRLWMSQYTEIEELEGVIATQDLLDLYIRESSLWRATTTGTSKWGTHQKNQDAKVKVKYNTRSPANTEKQVCPVSIKVWTLLISCKVKVFLSICFLLCYSTVRWHFFSPLKLLFSSI